MSLPFNITKGDNKMTDPSNPYYPIGIEIAGYLANDMSVPMMLSKFFVGCGIIFGTTYVIVKRVQPQLSKTELITIMWFVLSTSPLFSFVILWDG